jgi:itaconate CoA-transferase
MDDKPMLQGCSVELTNQPVGDIPETPPRWFRSTNFLEVDLTGQVCIGVGWNPAYFRNGGQFDFVKGAFDSPGGNEHSCVWPSTYNDGRMAVWAPHQAHTDPGTFVTVPRSCSHFIVI